MGDGYDHHPFDNNDEEDVVAGAEDNDYDYAYDPANDDVDDDDDDFDDLGGRRLLVHKLNPTVPLVMMDLRNGSFMQTYPDIQVSSNFIFSTTMYIEVL